MWVWILHFKGNSILLEARRRDLFIFLFINITYNFVFRAEDVNSKVSPCNQTMRSYILPGEGYTWSDRVLSLSYRKQETSKEEDAEWTQRSGDQAWVWRKITLQTKANASRKTQQPAVLNANERLNKMKRHKRLLDLASWKSIVTLTRVDFMMWRARRKPVWGTEW